MPIVVSRPWPGSTSRSAGSVNRRRSIDSMICSKSPPGRLVLPAPPGNSVSPLNSDRVALEQERRGARRVARVVDRAQPEVADRDHLVVGDHEVVGREHRRRPRRRCPTSMPASRIASTAWMWSQWPWVVSTRRTPVALLTSSRSSCSLAASMIDRLAGALAAHDEHVVLERADDELVDAHGGGLVVGGARHALQGTRWHLSGRPGRPGPATWRRSGSVRASSGTSPIPVPAGDPSVNFAFSDEQDQLRDAVRRFLEAKSPSSRSAAPDGDHRGLRPRGVEPDGQRARPPEPPHPRGVRRPGLHLRRARRSCSRRWAACCCARRTSRRVVLAANAIINAGTDDQKAELLPGIAAR